MFIFKLGDQIASVLLLFLPKRFLDRIQFNSSDYQVYDLQQKEIKSKPRMTRIEAVFTTILFDLALFGTSNWFIRLIIRIFTSMQNSWDKTFLSKEEATDQVTQFCKKLGIQQNPWIWEKPIQEYTSLNDFFSRTYQPSLFPKVGDSSIVSPASCTISMFNNNADMKKLLIKGCDYNLEDIGIPGDYIALYAKHPVFLGYLSPSDYHRVHSPISGVCTHCKMEGMNKMSSSVKFFGSKFNILNENRRLVIVIEAVNVKVAVVIIGGIGVDTIVYDDNLLGRKLSKCELLSSFRAGGSAVALFSTAPLLLSRQFKAALQACDKVEVDVGASLANIEV